ncbi:MAG: glycosyltransferase family 2 protein [Flavobacteriales bacterium]|nr:glycosyltransferase family 2 protein [Flavobacteriales bacterium]
MTKGDDWALVIPLANEEGEFAPFIAALRSTLDRLGSGTVYLVVDKVSKDRTLELSQELAAQDKRFKAIWAPENRNVVDAYLRGYREAYGNGHAIIIEMDAGLSHDPRAIPMFLRVLNEGNECAFGSRFINGGSITESNLRRTVLSKVGTILSNVLLGTRMYDTTSGYQGFHRVIVGRFLSYPLLSKAHFYQTELRYLLRRSRFAEIPIHYKAPSPRVSQRAIGDSIRVLMHYFKLRLLFRAPHL